MAKKKSTDNYVMEGFSSLTLMIPKKLHQEALAIARSQHIDIGQVLTIDVLKRLEQFISDSQSQEKVKENEDIENEDINLIQFDLFSHSIDMEFDLKSGILPSSKDVGASRLLVEDESESSHVTQGQFWVAYAKKLAPYMGDKESSAKARTWMGGLVKKYGPGNVMNAMMRLDNLAMMPANPIAWINKVLSNLSEEEAFKRNHGGKSSGNRSNSSGGMVNI
jgi:hypothetical protein